MAGINKVILVGNVGNDPDVKEMGRGGDLVANFSVATSESWKDKDTGDKKEKTEWHRVVAYRGLAEIVEKYVKKGSQLYIEGKLQTRKWEDKDGIERYTTEVIVDTMQMLGSRDSGNSGGGRGRDRDDGDDGNRSRGRDRDSGRDRDNDRSRSRGSRDDGDRDRGRSAPRRSDPMDDDIPFMNPFHGKRALAI